MYELPQDVIYPRTPEERFRVYVKRPAGTLSVLVTAESMEAVGVALGQLHEDARAAGGALGDEGVIGVYDVIDREWILNPFSTEGGIWWLR